MYSQFYSVKPRNIGHPKTKKRTAIFVLECILKQKDHQQTAPFLFSRTLADSATEAIYFPGVFQQIDHKFRINLLYELQKINIRHLQKYSSVIFFIFFFFCNVTPAIPDFRGFNCI